MILSMWTKATLSESSVLSCEPAEVNKQHVISFNLTSINNRSILVNSLNGPIWECQFGGNCPNVYQNRYDIGIHYFENAASLTITISNVSNEILSRYGDPWFGVQLGKETMEDRCVLSLFSRPKNVTCTNTLENDGFHLVCEAKDFYHPVKCNFSVLFNKSMQDTRHNRLLTNPEKLANNQLMPSCRLFVPKTYLNPGPYDVSVTMSGIVTNSERDIMYGTNITKSFRLEPPRAYFQNCTESASEHKPFVCNCTAETSNPVDVSVNWYDSNGTILHYGASSQVISFNVNRLLSVPATIHTLTANGNGISTTIERNYSVALHCHAEGNPIKELRLYNGPFIIGQAIRTIDVNYSMSCERINTIMCLVIQDVMGQIRRNMSVYVKCPFKLTNPNDLPRLFKLSHQNRSIVLHMFGYPKPVSYMLIQNGSSLRNFKNVTSLAMDDKYKIEYQEDVSPYGTLNLTFLSLLETERTHHLFIIDNGNVETLECQFTILTGPDTVYFDNGSNFTVWILAGGSVLMFLVVMTFCICCLCKRKASHAVQYNSPIKRLDSFIYEMIDSNTDAQHNVPIVENTNVISISDPHNSESMYSTIEEQYDVDVIQHVNEVSSSTVTKNAYDTLDKDQLGKYDDNSKSNQKSYDSDKDYITAIEEKLELEDGYVTVIGEVKVVNDERVTVDKKDIAEDKDYITVVANPYDETISGP